MQGFPKSVINSLKRTDIHLNKKVKKDITGKRFWLPVGFHPCWSHALNAATRVMNISSEWHGLIDNLFRKRVIVQVAWRNALPAAGDVIQNL